MPSDMRDATRPTDSVTHSSHTNRWSPISGDLAQRGRRATTGRSSTPLPQTSCQLSPTTRAGLLLGGVFWMVVLSSLGAAASAQDLRVLTNVSVQHPQEGRWRPLTRSLTLFHGGKVYDRVDEVGEVVIHEPSESQFVILSLTGNKMATRVRYEEVLQLLDVTRTETKKYMEELSSTPRGNNRNVIQALAFQLDPQFTESFDAKSGRLQLASEFVNYGVETASIKNVGVVEQYLDWASWTARLNFVLHPQAMTPESRLQLNQALRTRDRLPTEVDLTLTISGKTRLKAEHSFEWSLRTLDRTLIANWEAERSASDLRWVDLPEYQRTLVTTTNRRPR
ncbi:MAG: hypothetical protein KF861_10360 [Planctomycetaceae bacterium]|nr:hypothetical protein [Planctomycetaceae bacterium]